MRTRWFRVTVVVALLAAGAGGLAWALLYRNGPRRLSASVLNGKWNSVDGDSALEFKANPDDRSGDCTVNWRMTDKWTKYLPAPLVKEFSPTGVRQQAKCTLSYSPDENGRFCSSGSWGGDSILSPFTFNAKEPLKEGFTIDYIDANTVDVTYRILPNKIRYNRVAQNSAPQ